jgi:SAM-dependent methyltransferase
MHENDQLLFETYARQFVSPGDHILEIGPDDFPSTLQRLLNDPSTSWETLDIAVDDRLTYPGAPEYTWPVPDERYDVVLAANVIEHVRKIWVWIAEVERVCRTGGHVVILNPASWPYHPSPVDCWRIYPEGMKALLEGTRLHPVLTTQGSLEVPDGKYKLPGRARSHQEPRLQRWYRWTSRFGYPIECAFDTLTVARKEQHPFSGPS